MWHKRWPTSEWTCLSPVLAAGQGTGPRRSRAGDLPCRGGGRWAVGYSGFRSLSLEVVGITVESSVSSDRQSMDEGL